MSEQIHAPFAGALVIHPNGATVFGAVGEPVSPTPQMGVAEAAAQLARGMTAPSAGRDPAASTSLRRASRLPPAPRRPALNPAGGPPMNS